MKKYLTQEEVFTHSNERLFYDVSRSLTCDTVLLYKVNELYDAKLIHVCYEYDGIICYYKSEVCVVYKDVECLISWNNGVYNLSLLDVAKDPLSLSDADIWPSRGLCAPPPLVHLTTKNLKAWLEYQCLLHKIFFK